MLRFPLTTILLLLVAAAAPSMAWGSCGDWLAHAEPSSVSSAPLGNDDLSQDTHAPAGPQRCQGPLCKQSPPGPDPSVPTTEVYQQQVACLLRNVADNWARKSSFFSEAPFGLSDGNPFDIERPPQS